MQRKLVLAGFSLLIGCIQQPAEEIERPEERHIHSRVSRGNEGDVLVAATFSGGGAGDTIFRLLACPTGKPRCEVLTSISAADEANRPEVFQEDNRIILVVDEDDRIGGYRSFSRTIPSLVSGGIYLRYRQPGVRKDQ